METKKETYLVQMEEVVVEDSSVETIDVWEDFYDTTDSLEEARKNAAELLEKIKNHEVREVFEVSDPKNRVAVCISVYNQVGDTILDVIEVGALVPDEWNIKCVTCGAYCSEGTCFKYGHRVSEESIAQECWHCL